MLKKYIINNASEGYPQRVINYPIEQAQINAFARKGYCLLPSSFTPNQVDSFKQALNEVLIREESIEDKHYPKAEDSFYIRSLLEKDDLFANVYKKQEIISIARIMLGPQIRLDNIDARYSLPGSGTAVGWHIHLRVIPSPTPAFFCYPHQIHCLLYLDDVGVEEGALCVLPGSHNNHELKIESGNLDKLDGQETIYPVAGDCLLMHGNLWHRTNLPTGNSGFRRLLLFGFLPSWLRAEQQGVIHNNGYFSQRLASEADPIERELLGEFYWS